MTTKTKTDTNGSTPADENVGLTPEFVAKTIVLDEFSPSFGDMVDIEEAFGCSMADLFAGGMATARGMWATGWVAIHRVLPNVTPDDVRHIGPNDFKAKDAGQAQG